MTTVPKLTLPLTAVLWLLLPRVPWVLDVATNVGVLLLALCSAYWLLCYARRVFFNGQVDPSGKSVLITGCDTGLGHVLVKQLASDGFIVYAGCMDENGAGAKLLKNCNNVHVLQMDVTKENEIARAVESVENNLDGKVLWAVVANAGVPGVGYIEWQPMSRVRSMFEVNTLGALSVSTAFLPLLQKSKGRLVFVTSFFETVTMPECLGYCMSKQACRTLADGLRRQYASRGVRVCTIAPGAYRTYLSDHDTLFEIFDRDLELLPEKVRRDISEKSTARLKRRANFILSAFMRDDLQEAVDAMKMAVRDRMPRVTYRPGGWLLGTCTWLHDITPTEMVDEVIEGVRWYATVAKQKRSKQQ